MKMMGRIGGCSGWLWLVLAGLLAGCSWQQDRPLEFLGGGDPAYPAQARAAGIEGEVWVQYDIDAQGQVQNARVLSAEPPDLFDAAALETVRSWRFRPAIKDGQVQTVQGMRSKVSFKLGEPADYAH